MQPQNAISIYKLSFATCHKRCPRLRLVSLYWHMARHHAAVWL